ncbi:MAG: hypothetical protein LBD72_01830 [Puniceicoccales bacterium]|jgi:hypothetical protein|nr:hypothetical protein [Puniceicoccales bacterium]
MTKLKMATYMADLLTKAQRTTEQSATQSGRRGEEPKFLHQLANLSQFLQRMVYASVNGDGQTQEII